jgi:hypothetical protein
MRASQSIILRPSEPSRKGACALGGGPWRQLQGSRPRPGSPAPPVRMRPVSELRLPMCVGVYNIYIHITRHHIYSYMIYDTVSISNIVYIVWHVCLLLVMNEHIIIGVLELRLLLSEVWLQQNLSSKGWNAQVRGGLPGECESTDHRRVNCSREIGCAKNPQV